MASRTCLEGRAMTNVETISYLYRARTILLAAAILTLAGCASLWQKDAIRTEELLAAAGFQMQPADTPERLADLRSMPPRKLLAHSEDAKIVYAYADPDWCHCFYVGGPEEYSVYERLTLSKVIAGNCLLYTS